MLFTTSTYTDTGDIYKKERKKNIKEKYIGQQVLRAVIIDISGITNIANIADIVNIIIDIADIATDITDITDVVNIQILQ